MGRLSATDRIFFGFLIVVSLAGIAVGVMAAIDGHPVAGLVAVLIFGGSATITARCLRKQTQP